MARLNVLIMPSWYVTPDNPVVGVFVRDQALAVAAENDVVVLYCEGSSAGGGRVFELAERDENGLRTLRVRFRSARLPGWRAVMTLLGLAAGMRRLRREGFRPDVIHAHSLVAAVAAVALSRLRRIPVIVSEHWSGFARGTLTRPQALLARMAFHRAELVCPVSESLRAAIEPYAPRTRFRVVPNVVDTAAFAAVARERRERSRPLPRDKRDRPRLIAVALLVEVKGIAQLLEALARLAEDGDPAPILDVVGDGPDRAGLEAHSRELGLDGAVRFLGLRPRAEVAALLSSADLFVQASIVETFGVALVEALAAGLPVVATDVGIAAELIDKRSGILVVPNDPSALAFGIHHAVASLDSFDGGEAARVVGERFSSAAVARAWQEIYAQVSRTGLST